VKIFNLFKILKNKFSETENSLMDKFVLFVPDFISFISTSKIQNKIIIHKIVFANGIRSILAKSRRARCFGILQHLLCGEVALFQPLEPHSSIEKNLTKLIRVKILWLKRRTTNNQICQQ